MVKVKMSYLQLAGLIDGSLPIYEVEFKYELSSREDYICLNFGGGCRSQGFVEFNVGQNLLNGKDIESLLKDYVEENKNDIVKEMTECIEEYTTLINLKINKYKREFKELINADY